MNSKHGRVGALKETNGILKTEKQTVNDLYCEGCKLLRSSGNPKRRIILEIKNGITDEKGNETSTIISSSLR
jgi:hypothetical protein